MPAFEQPLACAAKAQPCRRDHDRGEHADGQPGVEVDEAFPAFEDVADQAVA
jgi:hypothetical protein